MARGIYDPGPSRGTNMSRADAAAEYDVAIVGAGVVGAAIARELARFELRVRPARGRPRRRRRHEQGQHGDPAHRFRRQAGHARGPAGAPRPRAAPRLRRAGSASRSSRPARCSSPGTRSSERLCPASSSARTPTATRPSREVAADELYRREPHLGPGAVARAGGPRRGAHLPVHDRAGVRDRGGARRLRAAARHAGHRRRAPAGARVSRWPPRRARRRPATSSTPPGCAPTRSTGCWATTASPSRPGAAS